MSEIVIQDLAFYQEIAATNHRGLVPMIFAQNAMPYVIGDIAGFVPKDARAMHGAGQAEPYFEDEGDRPSVLVAPARSAPLNNDEIARLDAIDVTPANLADGKLAQISLAKKIKNVPQNSGGINGDMALEIIRAELSRRGTALGTDAASRSGIEQGTGAVTSDNGTGPLGGTPDPAQQGNA